MLSQQQKALLLYYFRDFRFVGIFLIIFLIGVTTFVAQYQQRTRSDATTGIAVNPAISIPTQSDASGNGNVLANSGVTEYESFLDDSSLVAYWKAEDPNDSKSSFTLTNNSTVAFTAAKYANGFDFGASNTNNSVSILNDLGLNTYKAGMWSWTGWVKIATAPGPNEQQEIFYLSDSTKEQFQFSYVDVAGVKKLKVTIFNGSTANQLTVSQTLTVGTFYHLAFIKNGTTITLYVNGASIGSVTQTIADAAAGRADKFAMGREVFSPSAPLKGVIDDVAVFNKALSTQEITTLSASSIELGSTILTPFAASTIAADLELAETDYLEAADSASLSLTGDFTIELWIKPESALTTNQIVDLVSKSNDSTSGYSLQMYENGGNPVMGLLVMNGTNTDMLRIPHTPTVGEWHHYAATWTASTKTMELWRDGVSVGTAVGNLVTALDDNALPLRLGARASTNDRNYDGQMDEVRIWNDIRTSTEINTAKNSTLVGNEPNLVAYWPILNLSAPTSTPTGGVVPTSGVKTATLSLSPATSSVQVVNPTTGLPTLTVNVLINTGGASVTNADLSLTFDPAKLQVVSIVPGSFLPSAVEIASGKVLDNTNGVVKTSFYTLSGGQTGTGTFATIVFTGKAVTTVPTVIGINTPQTILYGTSTGNVFLSGTGATYTVTAAPTATPIPPTATPVPPTATPVPPTATSVPATPTAVLPTATPLPVAAVTVTTLFQGITTNQGNQTATMQFVSTSPTGQTYSIASQSLVSDPSGQYSATITNIVFDTYNLFIKIPGYLRKRYTVTVNSATLPLDLTQTPLIGGDVIDNTTPSKIDASDLSRVIQDYTLTTTTPADINHDSVVNALDIGLVINNYLQVGD